MRNKSKGRYGCFLVFGQQICAAVRRVPRRSRVDRKNSAQPPLALSREATVQTMTCFSFASLGASRSGTCNTFDWQGTLGFYFPGSCMDGPSGSSARSDLTREWMMELLAYCAAPLLVASRAHMALARDPFDGPLLSKFSFPTQQTPMERCVIPSNGVGASSLKHFQETIGIGAFKRETLADCALAILSI
jgi:hypothetical protein